MNKLDLLILAGAGVMIATAGGLWLTRDQIAVISPMRPDSSIPTFQPFDAKKHEKERRRVATGVPSKDDDEITIAFHRAARALRASPCNGRAKAAYLTAMTAFAKNNLRNNLERARRGEEDPRPTPLGSQADEYFNMLPMYGYISGAEYRDAMKGVTPGLALAITAEEAGGGGGLSMSDFAGSACDRVRRGEDHPAMSWEPQPGENNDAHPAGVRRRN